MNYTKKRKKIDKFLKENHSKKRYNHSVKVAEMSEIIAEKLGCNKNKAYIAGLSHDIAREFSEKKLKKLIKKEKGFSLEFYTKSNLYHGPAGARFLQKEFKIKDDEILEAVRYHSIGNKGISKIAKIVFVSDYISYDRKHITDDYRTDILDLGLHKMVLKVIDSTESHLELKRCKLLPETISMQHELKEKQC